jgi:hypothetical protein
MKRIIFLSGLLIANSALASTITFTFKVHNANSPNGGETLTLVSPKYSSEAAKDPGSYPQCNGNGLPTESLKILPGATLTLTYKANINMATQFDCFGNYAGGIKASLSFQTITTDTGVTKSASTPISITT